VGLITTLLQVKLHFLTIMSLEGKDIELPEVGTWGFHDGWDTPCIVIARNASNDRSTGQSCTIYTIDLKTKDADLYTLVKKKDIWRIEDSGDKALNVTKIELAKHIYKAKVASMRTTKAPARNENSSLVAQNVGNQL